MDTNVKKFKYSSAGKAICILLCVITFLTSCGLMGVSAMSYYYCQNGVPDDFTDSSAFSDVLAISVGNTMDMAYPYDDIDDFYVWYNPPGRVQSSIIRCYAQSDNTDSSHLTDYRISEEEAAEHDIYFIYKAGEISCKGISQEACDKITEYCMTDDNSASMNVYLYLDIPQYEPSNIIEYLTEYDTVIGLRDFHNTAVKYYDNLNTYLFFGAVMLITSFVFGFIYLTAAGRKKEGEPAKLAFIDYVPLEIHFAVYLGIGYGVAALAFNLAEIFYLSKISATIIVLAFGAVWFLLFEFCASVARLAAAERKFYKNFLVYDILKLAYIIVKKSVNLDIKIIRALKKRLKKKGTNIKKLFSALKYKPKMFKKNVIKIALIYVLLNLLALMILSIIWTSYYTDLIYGYGSTFMFLFAFALTAADAGVNIHFFRKVLEYIEKLDVLIETADKHEDVTLDIETLPQSLKILAESMKYTGAELQSAVAKAVRDERLKTELITNVSHDLKTPLTSIITYVDLLSKCDIPDEKAQEYIGVLGEKGAKLKRLIDDLMEASKINSGNVTVTPTNINLYELCLQATVEAQKDFEKADLELIVKESDCHPAIFADGPKAFRIIENLLSNAKKYSAKHSRVYVSVYEENSMGVFEIKNISAQPLDISPEELTKRFVRGDKSRNQEGNGLGLSIAKELCKIQNGRLELAIDGDLFKAKVLLPLSSNKSEKSTNITEL